MTGEIRKKSVALRDYHHLLHTDICPFISINYLNGQFYSDTSCWVFVYHKQMKYAVQHNTLTSHNIVLHVSVCMNNHQACLIKAIKKKKHKYILACIFSVSNILFKS